MAYKFERLEVWQLALEYVDLVYAIGEQLPRTEEYNWKSQMARAATSIALNIAEGSTSQSDAEQARFRGFALRSLVETVTCQHLVHRRQYLEDSQPLRDAYQASEKLFAKLQSFRASLVGDKDARFREEPTSYECDSATPF
ncbi:MAG: four helix bundle protein [Chloroflexi bacterium]|nr:four helix bundle protein [Chloroflexota bacterium]MBU1750815.1 four helix bundle protein [Chloroflexota bacterium]